MPQNCCSLCSDKIDDVYEFREMCYATNAQTRKLLGLRDPKTKAEIKVPTPSILTPTVEHTSSSHVLELPVTRKRKPIDIQKEEPVQKQLKKEKPPTPPAVESNLKKEIKSNKDFKLGKEKEVKFVKDSSTLKLIKELRVGSKDTKQIKEKEWIGTEN